MLTYSDKTGVEVWAMPPLSPAPSSPPSLRLVRAFPAAKSFTYSPQGSLIALVEPTCVRLMDAEGLSEVCLVPRAQVQRVAWSPLSTFLLTFARLAAVVTAETLDQPLGEPEEETLQVWKVGSGSLVPFAGWKLRSPLQVPPSPRPSSLASGLPWPGPQMRWWRLPCYNVGRFVSSLVRTLPGRCRP